MCIGNNVFSFFQMLYFNSILYAKVRRDRSMCPLAVWNTDEIKRLMKWIEHKRGYGNTEVNYYKS